MRAVDPRASVSTSRSRHPGQARRSRSCATDQPAESLQLARLVDPRDAAAQWCLGRYYAELDERFEGGFDLSRAISTEPDELMLPAGLIVVAWLHGDPVGLWRLEAPRTGTGRAEATCGSRRTVRGLGLGRRLLRELEDLARDHGASAAHLETNRALTEAIALYRASGYEEVASVQRRAARAPLVREAALRRRPTS